MGDDEYYMNVLLMDQPFYRAGMTKSEACVELEYLNNNLDSFYEGTYKPLWRQNSSDNTIFSKTSI